MVELTGTRPGLTKNAPDPAAAPPLPPRALAKHAGFSAILPTPARGRRTSGLHRVACHKCGRPTVTAGRASGYNGAGALCSTCRRL